MDALGSLTRIIVWLKTYLLGFVDMILYNEKKKKKKEKKKKDSDFALFK
jgi:hypothetical protein